MARKTVAKRRDLRSHFATSKTEPETAAFEAEILPPEQTGAAPVYEVRGQPVILDEDLAPRLGVTTKRLNEALKRNVDRFPEAWAFQLTATEYAGLDRKIKTVGSGGRRYLPWAFTEHGVVMAASVVRSAIAIQAMQMVVEVFVAARRNLPVPALPKPTDNLPTLPADGLSQRLKSTLDKLLDTIVDHKAQTTVRQEAQSLVTEAINSMKERLKKAELENEETAARAIKLIAQAEKQKAVAAKTRAETEEIEFATLTRKLRLVMEAERMMESGDATGFLAVLDRLGKKK